MSKRAMRRERRRLRALERRFDVAVRAVRVERDAYYSWWRRECAERQAVAAKLRQLISPIEIPDPAESSILCTGVRLVVPVRFG